MDWHIVDAFLMCDIWATSWENLSLEDWYQVRLKPACFAREASKSLETLNVASKGVILSRQQTSNVLSDSADTYGINILSHDISSIIIVYNYYRVLLWFCQNSVLKNSEKNCELMRENGNGK